MTLKVNSKAILDIVAGQKTRNATQAYKEIHPEATDITARTNAYKLMNKPASQIYLQKHVDSARETIVGLMKAEKDDIKLRAATDILDRSTGKAIQRTEVEHTGITLTIDLTSALTDIASPQ